MTTTFQIRIYDGTILKGLVTDMLWMEYTLRVNNFGLCRFMIAEDHEYAGEIQKNRRVEVWRKIPNAAWYREGAYLVRGKKYAWNGASSPLLVTAVSGNWLLGTRVMAWRSGTANRSVFASQPAETIAKTLVRYNLAADATVENGRVIDGNLSGVAVETDNGGGNTLDLACAWDNLLKTLGEVAANGGGDFDLAWTGNGWEFRWYEGQLGTDRTSGLVFSLARGNLKSPSLTQDWSNEKTLALIGGQGEGTDRNIRTRQGADWSAENSIEVFVDARDVESGEVNENEALDYRGEAALKSAEAGSALEFDIAQSEHSRYGKDYFFGDLGKAIYAGFSSVVQIAEVKVTFAEGRDEVITIGVKNA